MSAKIYVATAGDDIRFWQEHEQTAFARITPVKGPVACMDWSDNGLQVVACGQESQPLSVTNISSDVKNGPSINTTSLSALPGGASVTTFGHDQTNPTLAVGYDGGKIGIVSSRNLEVNKTLPSADGKRTVMSLCFDASDTRLAASDDSGSVIVHNVIQAVHGKPLPQADGAIVRQVKFSQWKKSLLASGSDSGSITLWDVYRSVKVHSFSATHSMPVTGIAFSPLNDMLLLSAGLDKQFCCLDLRKNQVVKTVHTDSAVCALDYHFEGWAVGLGTTRGRLLIYDLRQTSKPLREIAAHQTSVQTVKFASKNSILTSHHIQQKVSAGSPVNQLKTKPSTSTAISPLSANENTSARLVSATSSPDRLASFYTRAETAVKISETELNQKARILQAQRLLNQTPLISAASEYYESQTADAENIFRSQSVDVLVRARMDETFRCTTADVRLPSPISHRSRGGIAAQSEANIPNALNRPFPSAASTPFHPGKAALPSSTISSLPSRIPVEISRPDSASSFASAVSHSTALAAATEDSWSPSSPPSLCVTLRESAHRESCCEVHTQTLVVGEFPPAVSQKEVSTQTDSDFVDQSITLRDFSNLLDERLEPIDERLRRFNTRFLSMLCDQTAEIRKTMVEELSPNVQLTAEVERLKQENEQLRQTVLAYDAKLFNATLRL